MHPFAKSAFGRMITQLQQFASIRCPLLGRVEGGSFEDWYRGAQRHHRPCSCLFCLPKVTVEAAWQTALAYLRDGAVKLVLLDELNVALKLGYISAETVIAGLNERPELTHVAVTGRGAPSALVERADLVTEMTLVHHPFREQGVKAQAGIEY